MDAKGRFALPTRYRDRIASLCDGQLIATIDTEDRCLLIYPLPEWEIIEKQIDALPSYDPTSRRIKRLLLGHATELEIDTSGRALLPQPLRDHAELDKKLILLGQGKKFELWSEEAWNERMDTYLQEDTGSGEIPEQIMRLSL
jgi:MraZ protein